MEVIPPTRSTSESLARRDPAVLAIDDPSKVGEARRITASLARLCDLDDVVSGQASIIASELANNLARHARDGQMVLRTLAISGRTSGIEMLSIDRGPGIENVGQALADGYSTGGTSGTGLGAVKRLATEFDLYSQSGSGTVIMARLVQRRNAPVPMSVGVVCLPKPEEIACGDGWCVETDDANRTVAFVVDGLGHGLSAADAANQALRVFRENVRHPPERIVQALHAGLRGTRGAAVAVAEITPAQRELRFCGLGNISASIIEAAASRSLVSHNGTAGAEARRIQELAYPWTPDSLLAMQSDGIATHWTISQYPGLRGRHPGVIAGVLFRDHRRIRDDATMLVFRQPMKLP